MGLINPFILYGYESEEYFCDRQQETAELQRLIDNGNHVALMAPRRIGKTGLIENLFHQKEIQKKYYTFLIDIYATKSLEELVLAMGAGILAALRPKGKQVMQRFVQFLSSLRTGISFDPTGNPTWNVEIGDIKLPQVTLDEIFRYIETADKPCIIAIDEFQTISTYREKNIEAILRTHIQHCRNARFVFSGSQRTMMGEIFLSAARPFYQSTSLMNIDCLPVEKYVKFAIRLFKKGGKTVSAKIIEEVYQQFDGVTWYIQRVMNELYAATPVGAQCNQEMIPEVIANILRASEFTYQSMLFQLPLKQKELLIAICKAGKATELTSSAFIQQYRLKSASSVQAAIKGLVEKQFVTSNMGVYEVYDKFFALWLLK